jgi:CheY-like chemotaxis protein
MRILYVEDNPANLSLMQRIARMGGHEIISYTEGESALSNFDGDKPDLILLDVQLAGALTGLDVVRALRERGVTKPIVAVTAYAMLGDRERCLEAGFDTYISKPLPVAELVELVQKYEVDSKSAPEAATTPAETPAAEPAAASSSPAEPETQVSLPVAASPEADAAPKAETAASPAEAQDDIEQTQVDPQRRIAADIAAITSAAEKK